MTNRPAGFDAFHGQSSAVANLRVAVQSAKRQGKPLGHVLLSGPAGLGKTTLAASVLPAELGVECQHVNCAALESGQDLTNMLARMAPGNILFLDEIHMTPMSAREHLLTALEDSSVSVKIGEPPDEQILKVDLSPFTIIGATTRPGVLDAPLRSRFRYSLTLQAYTVPEMVQIIQWHADKASAVVDDNAAELLAAVSHGVARTGVSLLECCVDSYWATSAQPPVQVTAPLVSETLSRLGYVGQLHRTEFRYLSTLAQSQRPVGLKALSVVLDEHEQAIEDVYEPWLLRQGYITRGPSGREITEQGSLILKGKE
jgi:Holliday junction DNA helicase RuvB